MSNPENITIGSVVQVNPTAHPGFAGCFVLVTELYKWGVQGFVAVPHHKEEPPKEAYLRLTWEELEAIGTAAWVPGRAGGTP